MAQRFFRQAQHCGSNLFGVILGGVEMLFQFGFSHKHLTSRLIVMQGIVTRCLCGVNVLSSPRRRVSLTFRRTGLRTAGTVQFAQKYRGALGGGMLSRLSRPVGIGTVDIV